MKQYLIDTAALSVASGITAYMASSDEQRKLLRDNFGFFVGSLATGSAIAAGVVRIGDKRSFESDFLKFLAASVVLAAVSPRHDMGVSTVTGPLLSAGVLKLVRR